MEGLGQYVVSITAAALILGITTGCIHSKGEKELVRLLGGFLLTIVVLSPLRSFSLEDHWNQAKDVPEEAERWIQQGKEVSANALSLHITEEMKAYILDKAKEYDADIAVEIQLTGQEMPVPDSVTISGQISPYGKLQLMRVIEKDLGITKENQQWIS